MNFAKAVGLSLVLLGLGTLQLQAADTGSFERTLKVSGAVDLDITSGSGNVTVRVGGGDSVHVAAKIRAHGFFNNAEERIHKIESNPPVEQQGNTIRIGRIDDPELTRNISIDYDVTTPAQTKLNAHTGSGDQSINGLQLPLTAKTGSGNITVENMAGEVRISSGSGELKANSVKGALNAAAGSGDIRANEVAGDISATTGSGNIELEQVAAGNVKVETGSGNVKLRGVKGGLKVETGSGDIHAEGELTADWRVDAGSGNINLKVPSQASFNLDAKTGSGRLAVNHPFTSEGSSSKTHLQGKAGNGGVLLNIRTGSGDIEVD